MLILLAIHGWFNRSCQVTPTCTPTSTPQSASTPDQCCPLLNCFRYQLPYMPGCPGLAPFSLSNCPFTCRHQDPHPIHGASGPSASTIQTASWSVHFAGLTVMTDRLTDGPRYSICSNRLHLASAAMWPNNKTQQPIRHPFMQDNSSEQVPEKNTHSFTPYLWWYYSACLKFTVMLPCKQVNFLRNLDFLSGSLKVQAFSVPSNCKQYN